MEPRNRGAGPPGERPAWCLVLLCPQQGSATLKDKDLWGSTHLQGQAQGPAWLRPAVRATKSNQLPVRLQLSQGLSWSQTPHTVPSTHSKDRACLVPRTGSSSRSPRRGSQRAGGRGREAGSPTFWPGSKHLLCPPQETSRSMRGWVWTGDTCGPARSMADPWGSFCHSFAPQPQCRRGRDTA